MSGPISADAVRAQLDIAADLREYQLLFVALLGQAGRLSPDDLIVVGGSAIEIYTRGRYTSGDIDIVSSQNDRLREVLRAWGFAQTGRVWEKPEWKLVVDLVRYPYTGNYDLTTVAETPAGLVRVAAIEDLLVKRLMSTRFWKQPGDRAHAQMLADMFVDEIDWGYVAEFAKKQEVADLAAEVHGEAVARRGHQSVKS